MAMAFESSVRVALESSHAKAHGSSAGSMEPVPRLLALPKCTGLRAIFPSVGLAGSNSSNNYHRHVRLHATRGIICQQPQETLAPAGVVTDKTWKELVIDNELPVLVDFWAPWCGPCRMIAPLVDELAKQYAGRIKCYKLNTDESPNKATECGIRSIPTVLIFKGGEKKDAIVGAVPKTTLIACIEKFLDR